jgi:hypothetical protein
MPNKAPKSITNKIDSFSQEKSVYANTTGGQTSEKEMMELAALRERMSERDRFLFQESDGQKMQRDFMARIMTLKDAYDTNSVSADGLQYRNLMLEFGAKNPTHLAQMMVEHQETTNKLIGISKLIETVGSQKPSASAQVEDNMQLASIGSNTKGKSIKKKEN